MTVDLGSCGGCGEGKSLSGWGWEWGDESGVRASGGHDRADGGRVMGECHKGECRMSALHIACVR